MAEKEVETDTVKDTTETRIIITEDRHGTFNIEYMACIKGTEKVIPIRLSHLIGQLVLGSIILCAQKYKSLFSKEPSKK